jgi:hypothetical protein
MALYSSGIKTNILDPEIDNTQRTEFRLNADTVYLTNMRLLDVGLYKVGGSATKYNVLCGALGVIKSITLLDNGVQLDAIRNVSDWAGWKAVNQKNTKGLNVYNTLTKNGLSFITDGALIYNGALNDAEYKNIQNLNESGAITFVEGTTSKAWVDLKSLLPFLNSASFLNTKMFKNLSLVLEYQDNYDKVLLSNTGSKVHTRPSLVVDELINSQVKEEIMNDMTPINYVGLENDSLYIPAIPGVSEATPNPTQNLTLSLMGFNDKKVNRVLVQKEATQIITYKSGNNNNDYGSVASFGMINEAFQVRLNGENIYPGDGVSGGNKIQAELTDIYGDCIMPVGGVLALQGQENKIIKSSEVLGTTSYIGFSLNGKRVNDLYFNFRRTANYDTSGGRVNTPSSQATSRYNQALRLNFTAEVQKSVVFKNGGYKVQYL